MNENDKDFKRGDVYDDNFDRYDDYDDYYDEQFEDERYNRLLDEIADLKRTVTTPAPSYAPAAYTPPPTGVDVAMYNELSRLREELNRAQSTQNLHVELSRLKEEMNKRGQGETAAELVRSDELKAALKALQTAAGDIEKLKAGLSEGLPADLKEQVSGISAKLGDVLARLDDNADTADSLRFISEDISDIKETLGVDYEKLSDDVDFIKNRIGAKAPDGEPVELTGDDAAVILDELNVIKEKLSAADEYDVVAEILSLREEVKAARIVDQNDVSGELERVRAELADMRGDLAKAAQNVQPAAPREAVTSEVPVGAPTDGELNMLLNEIVSLRDEIQSYKDEVVLKEQPAAAPPDAEETGAILEELVNLRAEFIGLKEETEDNAGLNEVKTELETLKATVTELKDVISRRTTIDVDENGTVPASKELNVVIGEIIDIKDEVREESGRVQEKLTALVERPELSVADLLAGIAALPAIAGLKEDLEFVKNQLGDLQMAVALSAPDEETDALKAENEGLKAQLAKLAGKSGEAELAAVKKELDELKAAVRASADELKAMREEPDLSVMSEILALREEYQAMKEQLEKSTERDDKALYDEIGKLRDQLFAISMASVNDGASDQVAYESYNNIILDEISALRDEFDAYKKDDKTPELADDVAYIKEKMAADDKDAIINQLNRIKAGLEDLKKAPAAEVTGDLTESLTDLKSELTRIAGMVNGPAAAPQTQAPAPKPAPQKKQTGKRAVENANAILSRIEAESAEIKTEK